MSEPPLYVALDECGFKTLLRGMAVTLNTVGGQEVRLILKDIGWGRIINAVEAAFEESRKRHNG
jgi:hypothetical protein